MTASDVLTGIVVFLLTIQIVLLIKLLYQERVEPVQVQQYPPPERQKETKQSNVKMQSNLTKRTPIVKTDVDLYEQEIARGKK